MEASTSAILSSWTKPPTFFSTNNNRISFRHSFKHLQGPAPSLANCISNPKAAKGSLKCSSSSISSTCNGQCPFTKNPNSLFVASKFLTTTGKRENHLVTPFQCSYSSASSVESENILTKIWKKLSSASLKETLLQLTPLDICKSSVILCVFIAATKWIVNLLLSPFFWMYFSWTWLFWPWFLAIGLAIYGFYCFHKHSRGEANIFEQLIIVTSAFTWLTLVPPAHFNGFLEGWPFVFFFVYHYFFFFNVSVRKRLYGDLNARDHESKWDIVLPMLHRFLFCVGVMAGHWLAAFEGPELHIIPGGWSNLGIWVLIMVTLFMQYHSTLYLAKYSEKVVVPTSVVQFGPYRWVRHPIYASVMLLFATYCIALRATLSLLFIVAVCLIYYDQKAKLEEGLMIESFGERYSEYMSKVKYKFIPFLY